MNLASAISKIWNDCTFVFSSTGYSFFKIEANIVCSIVLAVLFHHQQNSSDQTEARVLWCRLLFVQVLHCVSWILRVFVDVRIIPVSPATQYIFTVINAGLFSCMCMIVFIYTENFHGTKLLDSFISRIVISVPFVISIFILAVYPLFDISIEDEPINSIMLVLSLGYLLAAVILSVFRHMKQKKYKIALYPAFLFVFGLLQSLNWRVPLMSYAILAADVFVYINYTDSLVSVDPLTKIPNRNGFMRHLNDRMDKGNVNQLYVFAVDIDDLSSVNSNYGRSEGDHALIVTANALKKFRSEAHKCYAARYYSDEFMIAADIESDEELELFTEHVRNYISNASISNGLAYHIRVSIGCSHYEKFSRTETITGLIEEAERLMTENKEQRKFQNLWQKGINA